MKISFEINSRKKERERERQKTKIFKEFGKKKIIQNQDQIIIKKKIIHYV